jgi:hypothetical protein
MGYYEIHKLQKPEYKANSIEEKRIIDIKRLEY